MAEKLGSVAKKVVAGKTVGINAEVLKTLVSRCDGVKAKMDSQRGELGSLVKDAEDTHGINRKAFKLMPTLKRMEENKRADFLRSLDDYREKLGFNDQSDLFDEGGDEEKRRAAQDAEEPAAKNAKALKAGIKPLDAVH